MATKNATKPRVLTGAAAIDGGVVALMLVAALAGFWPVFGSLGFIRPALVGLILGAIIAWLGAWKRLRSIVIAVGVILAYFLFGTLAALWTRGIAGFLPNLSVLRTLVFGSVGVWKQFVTASTPVATFPGFTLVPYMVALVGAAAAFSAAWRARRPAWTLLAVAATTAVVVLFGTTTPWYPVAQALVIMVVGFVWLNWRRRRTNTDPLNTQEKAGVKTSRLINTAIMLVAAGLVAGGVGGVGLDGLDREVIRRYTVPPLDLRAYPSPLASFRTLVDDKAEDVLFTVDGWEEEYLLRLAVMDDFDGMVYNVGQDSAGSRYDRVGPELGGTVESAQTATAQVDITTEDYAGVWVPGVSALRAATFHGDRGEELTDSLYYNSTSDALVDPAGLTTGDAYTLGVDYSGEEPTADSTITDIDLPEPKWVPEQVGDLALQWSGDAQSAYTRVSNVIDQIHATGFFSHGLDEEEASRPGHSSNRIEQLLSNPDRMIGDDEQYAVLAALMLRELGIPARVVMGFYTDDQSTVAGGVWQVTGSDTHAWVEVPFDDVGWYPFIPTPEQDQQPQQEEQQTRAKPKPQVLQPPPASNDTDDEDRKSSTPERDEDQEEEPFDWGPILRIVAAVGIPLIIILGPIVAIIAIKATRSAKRRKADSPAVAITGGWREFMDRVADMGAVAPATATRSQVSAALTSRFGAEGVQELAHAADRGAFAAEPPHAEEAKEYWSRVDHVIGDIRGRLPWRKRMGARIALTSLFKAPTPNIEMEVE